MGDSPWRPARSDVIEPRSARDGDASRSFASPAAGGMRAADRRDHAAPPSSPGSADRPLEHFPAATPPNTPASSTDSADYRTDRSEIPWSNAGMSAATTTALNGSRRRCGLHAPTVPSTITQRVDRPLRGRLTSAARSLLLRAASLLGRCRFRLYDNAASFSKTDALPPGPRGTPPRRSPETIPSTKTARTNPALPRARHDRKPALFDDRFHRRTRAAIKNAHQPKDERAARSQAIVTSLDSLRRR
jgi:hypothetical protein